MGDRFFDLANFSINHELDAAQSEMLLEAYFGEVRDADVRALELMRFMSDFREAMWGVVQSAVSELDFDFDAYAAEHFERLRRTAESRDLRRGSSRAERTRGALRRPSSNLRRAALRSGLGRQLELAELLLLEPLELLLRAHAHRALEPVLGRDEPPAAEDESDPDEPEDRVVRQLPVEESFSHGRPTLYSGKTKRIVMSATQRIAIDVDHL